MLPSGGKLFAMDVAVGILISVVGFLTAALLFSLFVWAARKDGEEDRALQARLGIRRKTRLGR